LIEPIVGNGVVEHADSASPAIIALTMDDADLKRMGMGLSLNSRVHLSRGRIRTLNTASIARRYAKKRWVDAEVLKDVALMSHRAGAGQASGSLDKNGRRFDVGMSAPRGDTLGFGPIAEA
jgi:hypothetical protein